VRILHLVTLLSSDGAFGGPFRVALNQAVELRRRGHDVRIAAGWRGDGLPPQSMDGVPLHLFPVIQLFRPLGFTGIVSPKLASWLSKNIADYDVLHIHAGRDFISLTSLSIAWSKRRPYVIQSHGMIQPDPRLIVRLIDMIATRRFLKGAKRRFVLTDREQDALEKVLDFPIEFELLFNGVPEMPTATASKTKDEVLFCGRLHERKRPVAFVEMAAEILQRGTKATFALVGPDDGELTAVCRTIQMLGLKDMVCYEGALSYEAVLDRMGRSGIYVFPSVDEPFGMSLLEALSLGIPAVCTDTCDIAPLLRTTASAIVTNGSVDAMASAVVKILQDNALRNELGRNGRKVVSTHFSMKAVANQLEQSYGSAKVVQQPRR
jgi:glycosyltransferase involved in cell wall biosynthesis